MKKADGWYWPDEERHMLEWLANPKNRRVINGRAAYQGKKQEAIRDLCKAHTHMRTAVDVGAHIGLWSWNLSHWFKRVEAYEPVAAHRDCFMQNLIGAPNVAQVQLHASAVGREIGSVSIRVNPTSTGDSWVKGAGDIPMVTLDSQDLEDVDLIKIDTEGFEANVVMGAEATIKRWRPIIIVEQKRDFGAKFGFPPRAAVDLLVKFGMRQAFEIGGDYLMVW